MSANRIAILAYHSLDDSGSVVSVSPEVFARQMESLAAARVRGVALRAALEEQEKSGRWPQDAAVITFDDGFANLHEHAAPVLKRLGFAATLFLITGHVGGKNDWAPRPAGLPELGMLSWSQVKELAAAGWEIAAHTHAHPDLRRLTASAIEQEYQTCNRLIAEQVGTPAESFAYPYGFRSSDAEALARASYRAAVTTTLARAGTEEAHLLPRVDVYYARKTGDLTGLVSGAWDGYLTVRRWGRGVKAVLS